MAAVDEINSPKTRRKRNIAARIRLARLRRGWSQARLGAEVGKSREYVNKWENAVHEPDAESMERLSEVFGYPAAWFLEGL